MIFYIVDVPGGPKQIFTRQDEAKKTGHQFTKADIPPTQAGIKALLEDCFEMIHKAESQPAEGTNQGIKPPTPAKPQESALEASTAKSQLEVNAFVQDHWEKIPFALRCDLVSMFFEDVRKLG